MSRSLVALIGGALVLGAVACRVPGPAVRPASPMETRYRMKERAVHAHAAVATRVYRGLLGRSLFSRCAMVPHDSAMFDLRLHRCGVIRAVVVSVGRLFLERAATPQYLQPVRMGGRLRWIDLPAGSPCD